MSERDEARAEVERLREGVQAYLDGNYDHPRRHRPTECKHGIYYTDACENCVDEHFAALLTPPSNPA
ncbi:hypothetical protein [Methylobacterium oryzisoli]|uniref:hypothetical protein n=1 Tax=Methylobacterium oryzisoli TaxID=3385502 RepID=UPI0038925613